jgi:hypothetical protein
MENSGLSASDVLALTRGRDDTFGGVGGFILLFIFLMAISGNGFGFGGNTGTAFGLADIQASLYNQTQDANSRQLQTAIAGVNDSVLTARYDNSLLMKDASQQLSNSIASIGNLVVQENQATRNMIMQNKVDMLSDQITVLRGENSNLRQNEYLLSQLATTAPKPPCYYPSCGCGTNSLY